MSKVTVIIPVYNSEKYINETIESILMQTCQDFELLLIDDASTDGSLELIQTYQDSRIKVLRNEKNLGIAMTRNRGIEEAKTEYLALLDHDDIAMPWRLEHEITYLDEHPDVMVIGGHHREIDCQGKDLHKQWTVYLNSKYIKAFLMLNNAIVNGSTMFRKSFLLQNQILYKDNLCGAEDYLFWVECSLHGKIKNLDEVMLLWRRTEKQQTNQMLKHSFVERNQVLGYIRKVALEGNGYQLSDNDYAVINKVFEEESSLDSKEEISQLFSILQKLVKQASDMKADNLEEVIAMCRKRFGEKIAKAFFLWN